MHNLLQFNKFRASLAPLQALGVVRPAINKEHCYIYDGPQLVCYYKLSYFKKSTLWHWKLFIEQFEEVSVIGPAFTTLKEAKDSGRVAVEAHVTKTVTAYRASSLEL